MKTLTKIAAGFIVALAFQSCKGSGSEGDVESNIDNPPTSQEVSPAEDTSSGDTTNPASKNDAMRMSHGKDSLDGEVTPPNANEQ